MTTWARQARWGTAIVLVATLVGCNFINELKSKITGERDSGRATTAAVDVPPVALTDAAVPMDPDAAMAAAMAAADAAAQAAAAAMAAADGAVQGAMAAAGDAAAMPGTPPGTTPDPANAGNAAADAGAGTPGTNGTPTVAVADAGAAGAANPAEDPAAARRRRRSNYCKDHPGSVDPRTGRRCPM